MNVSRISRAPAAAGKPSPRPGAAESPRPGAAEEHPHPLPAPPYLAALVGAGRVGGAFGRALAAAGHRITAEIHRGSDPAAAAAANVVIIAVPDDALAGVAASLRPHVRRGAVVVHTSGLHGLEPLAGLGPHVAAVHPAVPVPDPATTFEGAAFGVTCPPHLARWCEQFAEALGGWAHPVPDEARAAYHAALVIASNLTVALAGDAAEILGGHRILVPLLRQSVENIARLGPDAALTGPVVRGDAGTVRAHLDALPEALHPAYRTASARALARAVAAGRLDPERAEAVAAALDSPPAGPADRLEEAKAR